MAVLRESPWYQEILEEGLERGLEQGRRVEREEMLVHILKRRFGDALAELRQKISELETEQLSGLLDVALEASSLAEVEAFLSALLANGPDTNRP